MGKRSLLQLMFWGSYRRPILKIALWILFIILWIMVTMSAALQVPIIQTQVTQYLAVYLSNRLGNPVSVGAVSIKWLSHFTIHDLEILDEVGNNLIKSEKVKINFSIYTFKREKVTRFRKAVFENATVRVFRNEKDGDFNISYLVDNWKKFKNADELDSIPALFEIKDIELKNTTLIYIDPFKDSLFGKFNYHQFRLKNINAVGGNLKFYNQTFTIDIKDLSFLDSV